MPAATSLPPHEVHLPYNPKLTWFSALIGLCLGYFASTPLLLVYGFASVFLPISMKGNAFWILSGGSAAVGAIWGYWCGARYKETGVTFDRDRIQLIRDRIVRQEIAWSDVEKVDGEFKWRIYGKHGELIEVPYLALQGESFEVSTLRRQLTSRIEPKVQNFDRYIWPSALLFVAGLACLIIAKKPYDIFVDADPFAFETWLRIAPSIFGCVASVIGMLGVGVGILSRTERKRPHPFVITDSALSRGAKVLTWANIRQLRRWGAHDLILTLDRFDGKTWTIDCRNYTNGAELRDSILSHMSASRLTIESLDQRQLITGNTFQNQKYLLALLVILLTGCFVPIVGVLRFGWRLASPAAESNFLAGMLGVLAAILLLSLGLLIYRVELDADSISIRYAWGIRRRVLIADIQKFELKTSGKTREAMETLTVFGTRSKFSFASVFQEYGEIRDHLLERVPQDKVWRDEAGE